MRITPKSRQFFVLDRNKCDSLIMMKYKKGILLERNQLRAVIKVVL